VSYQGEDMIFYFRGGNSAVFLEELSDCRLEVESFGVPGFGLVFGSEAVHYDDGKRVTMTGKTAAAALEGERELERAVPDFLFPLTPALQLAVHPIRYCRRVELVPKSKSRSAT
jgi:hypothetical protein